MTPDDRSTALQLLGYTPRQAAFLALVAVHGGYFLRRQYAAFLERPDGGVVTDLLQRLLARRHARRHPAPRDTHVYHLCARPLYAAIDEHDSRNRRPALPAAVAVKLMTLDVVVPWRDRVVLGTEAEKVAFFTEHWAIPRDRLPATVYTAARPGGGTTTRYFVDKAPIALTRGSAEVTVAYVQGWSRGVGGFVTFLKQYRSLFASLPAVRLLYCTTRPDRIEPARRVCAGIFDPRGQDFEALPDPDQLAAHFRARRQLDQADLSGFDQRDLDQLRADSQRFAAPHWQALYARWCVAGDAVLASRPQPPRPRQGPRPRFDGLVLRHWYPVLPPTEASDDGLETPA